MKNLKEFKALIERYESITLEEIEENWVKKNYWDASGELTAMKLTGFGDGETCSLCKAVGYYQGGSAKCDECVYEAMTGDGCQFGENSETYETIMNAQQKRTLLNAFRNRAKHMRTILDQINEAN
jgi:hypothetical protein